MAESLVSFLVDQLVSITTQQATQQLNPVTGADEAVNNLTSNLHAIKAELEDAEKRQVNESAVKHWLAELKDVSYDIDDVLDEWNTAILKRQIEQEGTGVTDVPPLKKVRSSILSPRNWGRKIVSRHDIALKIKEVDKRLDDIANQRSRYNFTSERSNHEQTRNITTSVIDESEVFAREEDKQTLKDMLLCESSETACALRIISFVGMGGIGKTTLSRLAYNDAQVKSHFEKRIWVCVSDPFEEERISLEILEYLVGKNNIQERISELVSGKKILLVLDDVWTEDSSKWEQLKGCLKNSSPTSRILLTTRKEMVGRIMGCRLTKDMFFLGKLSEDKCWSLFSHLAFFERTREERQNLEGIGRKIVEKCKGLPLAVKVLGGLLRFRETKEQWQSILESKMWEIEEVEKGVFPPLLLSYYDLTPTLRRCFSYCAIFPKDFLIQKDKLINLWMAQGFIKEKGNKGMEIIGEEYFNTLAMRSFFQDFEFRPRFFSRDVKTYCNMHDIVHDFAQLLTEKECVLVEFDGEQQSWKNLSFETIRHLMLMFRRVLNGAFPIPMENWKKLHTIVINYNIFDTDTISLESLLSLAIDHLTCLRAMDFSVDCVPDGPIKGLLDKIGKLTHLRYLNLCGNRSLIKLPEAICDLCNLQILDITGCEHLTELPRGIGKLINLVYLENEGTWNLRFMPKGMERLMRLRTLKEFVLSDRGDDMSCSLQGLGKLNHLQGDLKIRGLGKVAEASEAIEARLSAKTGLRTLTLSFYNRNLHPENEAFVVEALQPPPNLETLDIRGPKGPTLFPKWMMSLNLLKSVELRSCANWESVPPMGKLPSLEHLEIRMMHKVKKVGEEFLVIERETSSSSSSSSSSSVIVSFPNLKSLVFASLIDWEEWEYDQNTSRNHGGGGGGESSCITIDIMPRLQSLTIKNCPKLKALPHHLLHNTPTIQQLYIRWCRILKERFEKGRGKD